MKIGLNVGSGQRPFTSAGDIKWINIDKVEREGQQTDLICSGENLPYESGTVDYVVLHHVLEHFGCGEGEGLVKEAYRVLREGGLLFVYVPDMRALCGRWLAGAMDTQLFMTNVYGAYMGSEEDRHKWGFDVFSLNEFLRKCAPWESVGGMGVSLHLPGADIAHDWWILEAECLK